MPTSASGTRCCTTPPQSWGCSVPTAAELAAMNAATGNLLFQRRARLVIEFPVATPGDFTHTTSERIEIDGFGDASMRIRYTITKTLEKEPNPGEITVTNLSPEHRARAQVKGAKLLLEVGYEKTGLSRIFAGDSRSGDSTKVGPDWETRFRCGDGERAYAHAFVSEGFDAGVTVGDVVRHCAQAMGLPLGNTAAQATKLNLVLYQGWAIHGPASTALDQILRMVDYSFSIQDGQLQILGPGEAIGKTIPELSPETGLIGSPELGSPEKKGGAPALSCKSFVMPAARPGGLFSLRSERHVGVFKWKKAVHSGDTRGPEWFTTHEAHLTSGASVVNG